MVAPGTKRSLSTRTKRMLTWFVWLQRPTYNKLILENCKKRKQNLSCAWIDYEKSFHSVPHEWILRSLELFKVSPRVAVFLKHNMKNW